MSDTRKATFRAKNVDITVIEQRGKEDYLSLTDIARYKSDEPNDVIRNWMRAKDTIEFLGLWEVLNNPEFKPIEFDGFRSEAGTNAFTLAPKKWIESTHAVGIITKSGRYGGTYAHKDIALEFASWISAEFKLYIIKDYQKLKAEENSRLSLNWNLSRELSKINYRIHTDAIQSLLIPPEMDGRSSGIVYASEADVLNIALFGKTAAQWRMERPDADGNIRDEATIRQLIVLSNMESMNAELIKLGVSQGERAVRLNRMAIEQMRTLLASEAIKRLE